MSAVLNAVSVEVQDFIQQLVENESYDEDSIYEFIESYGEQNFMNYYEEYVQFGFSIQVETYLPEKDLSTERFRGNLMQAGIRMQQEISGKTMGPDNREIL